MNLLSLLCKSLLADGALSALAKKTGLSSAKLKKLIPLAVPLLLKALTNNASSQGGLQSLLGALTQHKNTRSVAEQIRDADTVDGGKILTHILGKNADAEVRSLAVETGLDDQEVRSALSSITPSLLSGLSAVTASGAGKPKCDLSDGVGMDDVMAIFGGAAAGNSSSGGLLGGLLGGSKPAGGGLLGGLFGGRQEEEEQDNGVNGTALLNLLMSAMR